MEIATTSDAVRKELLGLAKQMPNSPLADAAASEVALADRKLVSKRDASRAVSIADAMPPRSRAFARRCTSIAGR
jgi:xanthine dehydrogenase YagR molybdenum-binding subunit